MRTVFPLLLLAAPLVAQGTRVVECDGPPRRFTYVAATGEVRFDDGGPAARVGCFANTSISGSILLPAIGTEWIDWGVKSGGCGDVLDAIDIGYGTLRADPSTGGPGAAFDFALFTTNPTGGTGYMGSCTLNPASEVLRLSFTGLPGTVGSISASYVMTIDLTGLGVDAEDGALGWSYVGVDANSGPLMINVGVDPTGTVDQADEWTAPATSGTCLGTKTLTGGRTSFYLELDEQGGSTAGPLSGAPPSISLGSGGTQVLTLDFGAGEAGKSYLVAGSVSGTSPGFAYGGAAIPLNPDVYTIYTVVNPGLPPLTGSGSTLDANGQGAASFGLPAGTDPTLVGLTVHHAAAVIEVVSGTLIPTKVSNAVAVTLEP